MTFFLQGGSDDFHFRIHLVTWQRRACSHCWTVLAVSIAASQGCDAPAFVPANRRQPNRHRLFLAGYVPLNRRSNSGAAPLTVAKGELCASHSYFANRPGLLWFARLRKPEKVPARLFDCQIGCLGRAGRDFPSVRCRTRGASSLPTDDGHLRLVKAGPDQPRPTQQRERAHRR